MAPVFNGWSVIFTPASSYLYLYKARAQEGDIASSDPLAELHKGDLISENVLKTNNQLFSIILSSTHRKQLFLYSYSKLTDFRIINDVKKFLHQ